MLNPVASFGLVTAVGLIEPVAADGSASGRESPRWHAGGIRSGVAGVPIATGHKGLDWQHLTLAGWVRPRLVVGGGVDRDAWHSEQLADATNELDPPNGIG